MPDSATLKQRLLLAVVPGAASLSIRALRATLRIEFLNRRVVDDLRLAGRTYIHAFWHGRLLLMPYSYRGPRISVLISRHRDGEYIARTMRRFGVHATRGSSTAGGPLALRQAARLLQSGWDVGFTPDGPRGPARVVQPGVVQAARLSGAPIVPVTFAAARAWRLRSWDSFLVPRPFTRGLVAYGEPITVPRRAGEAELEAKRRELEGALDELTERADRVVSATPEPEAARGF